MFICNAGLFAMLVYLRCWFLTLDDTHIVCHPFLLLHRFLSSSSCVIRFFFITPDWTSQVTMNKLVHHRVSCVFFWINQFNHRVSSVFLLLLWSEKLITGKFIFKTTRGMIEFNYLDFWFSTFWHVFPPFSTWKNVFHVEKGKKTCQKVTFG